MNNSSFRIIYFLLPLMYFASCKEKTAESANMEALTYPETRKDTVVDTYFGEGVADLYRWLEDDLSAETAAWVDAQNKVTFDYLDKIPFRKDMKARLEKIWNYEKFSAPFKEGDYTYFYKNDGLQNQFVLWRKASDGTEEVFLDPNTFSTGGTTSLAGINFSKDGSKVAYQISEGGSDWRKVIILDAVSKKIQEDALIDIKFSGISWFKNEGFYYSSYDKPKGSELSAKTDQHKLYYHKLGTPQSADKVVFGDKTKRRYVSGDVTYDANYLVVTAATSTSGNELYLLDLANPKAKMVNVVSNFDNDHNLIDNEGTKFLFTTNLNAPNKKVISFDLANPSTDQWIDVIPQTENVLDVSSGGGTLYAHYMKDALSNVKQYDYTGKLLRDIELPGLGTASVNGSKKEDTEVYFSFTNYTTPSSIYVLSIGDGKSSVYKAPKVDFNSADFESKQVFYTSKDGTKVPMMITHKKGIKLDGNNPTMLYAYGGFNISLTPGFSISNAVWLEQGGIYAVPNIRGGGEYGKKWHDAGTQMQKQNVFDDFIAAAEYLIKEKYTSSDFLAIAGGSNGGLLVGACMTQRPDLYKVALPAVGVLDMLRYHTFTAGAGWAYDYGTSEQSKEMFDYLKGYSPLHNAKPANYPATLVTTADHDDRVVPSHSFKFIAALQANQTGPAPVLIRIDKSAGHGAGKPTSKIIDEAVDKFSFTLYQMGKSYK